MWRKFMKFMCKLSCGSVLLAAPFAYNGCFRAVQDNIEGMFAPEAIGNEGLLARSIIGWLIGI